MSSHAVFYSVAPDPRLYHTSYDAYGGFRRETTENSNTRSYQREHYIIPAPTHSPLCLPAPPVPPAATTNLHRSDYPASANMNPYEYQQQGRKDSENHPHGILKPAPTSYPAPFPGMYPILPHQVPSGQFRTQLHPPYGPQRVPGQGLPFPTQPPGMPAGPPLPPGARVISPPRLPTADELKYKCSICGQLRSTRYHYLHPIPPGQLPNKTICRRCQEDATDSEDETDSSERPDRRRSRSQRRAASADAISRRARSRRGRSRSRVVYTAEEDYDYYQPLRERSWSRSSSLEVEALRQRSRRTKPRRRRSPSVEVVRYVEHIERPKLGRRITYIEELPKRTYDDQYDDGSGGYDEEYHIRRIARPPTPAPRVIRRQYSDPFMLLATPGRHQDYPGTPPPLREASIEMALAPRSQSRPPSHHRIVSVPHTRSMVQPFSETDDDFYERGRQSSYGHPPSRSERSRGRSMSNSRFREDNPRHRSVSVVRRTKNPDQSPQSQQELGSDHADHDVRYDRDPLPVRSHRRRPVSRSQSAQRPVQASRLLQSGDEVTVIEYHGPNPSEDYEHYDKDGMRVRVREI